MKYKTEMEDLDRKLVEYTNNDTSFQVTSAYLLELASKAKNIFERSQPEQKNKILRMLLTNPTLKAKRLQLPLLKPFASVLDNSNSQNWLPVPVSIDSTEVNATNETLLDYPNISHEIILNDEERARMVNYFNVLIEMDYLQKNNQDLTL